MRAKILNYDERVRITDAFERIGDAKQAAEVFGISIWEVCRLNQKKKAGGLAIRTHARGRKSKRTDVQRASIRKLLDERPDITVNYVSTLISHSP